MGKSVVWDEAGQAANPEKKIYLGKVFQGALDGRDVWKDEEGKDHTIYRIRRADGTFVSVWSTAVIRTAMEEGCSGKPVPEGSIVRFTHQGQRKSPTKGRKPYHDVLVEYSLPKPSFETAQKPAAPATNQNDPFND